MNNELWIKLCEAVWNKDVVVDTSSLKTTIRSLERWFLQEAYKIPRAKVMKLAAQLITMLRENMIQTADYGDAPEALQGESLVESKRFLEDDIEMLKSFTPELLKEAGESAGFDLDVWDVTTQHPLGTWE